MGAITEDTESDIEEESLEHLTSSPSVAAPDRQPAGEPSGQRSFQSELPLAGYVLARDVVKKPVNDGLERLRIANDSVNQTREMLPYGRGNVRTDIEATAHESSARTMLAQELAFELSGKSKLNFPDAPHAAGAARFMQAGACSEHANVAIHVHAEKLQEPGDSVHFAYRPYVNHAWSEVRPDRKNRLDPGSGKNVTIVMDPWAEGPAVYSADGRHTKNRRGIRSGGHYNNVTGPEAAARAGAVVERLAKTESPEDIAADIALRRQLLPSKMLHDAKPVVHQDFAQRVARRMSQPVTANQASSLAAPKKPSRLSKAVSAFKHAISHLGDGKEARARAKHHRTEKLEEHQSQKAFALQQLEVRNEIKAIGVARALGYGQTVKEAVQQARPIVDAAKNLGRPERTGQVIEAMTTRQGVSAPPGGSGETSGVPTTELQDSAVDSANEQRPDASPGEPRIGSLGWYLKTTPP